MSDAGQDGAQGAAGTGAAQGGAGDGGKPWFDALDSETKGYIQNRGLEKGDAVAAFINASKAHREAGAKLGIPPDRVLRWPDKTPVEDRTAWKDIFAKQGVPEKPEEYDFTGIEVPKEDADFLNTVREFAFAHNLPKETAKALAKELADGAAEDRVAETKAHEAAAGAAVAELKKAWGFNYPTNVALAKVTAEKLGIKPEAIAEWEKQTGTIAVMEAMLKIGSAMGEDKFVQSPVTGSVMSRDQAAARKAELMADPEFKSKLARQDAKAWAEMTDLNRLVTIGMGPPPGFRA